LAELIGTQPLEWWLAKKLQSEKILGSKIILACADSTCMTGWIAWYRKFWSLQKALLQVNRVLNSKYPTHSAK
jgi:hypothetical protein